MHGSCGLLSILLSHVLKEQRPFDSSTSAHSSSAFFTATCWCYMFRNYDESQKNHRQGHFSSSIVKSALADELTTWFQSQLAIRVRVVSPGHDSHVSLKVIPSNVQRTPVFSPNNIRFRCGPALARQPWVNGDISTGQTFPSPRC